MASAQQEMLVSEVVRCYHCGSASTAHSFKYFDNKKEEKPRHQCHDCHKLFTLGAHGRSQGKTYQKKRNQDPAELKNLSRQCCHCGVEDHAVFKYYNNKSSSQPRFKCLSCGKQFQMRLLGTGRERRLVHTRSPCRHRTQGVPEFGAGLLLSEMNDEDVEFSHFLEAQLADENVDNDVPLPQTVDIHYGDNVDNHAENCKEDEQYVRDENQQAPNADSTTCPVNGGDGLLWRLSVAAGLSAAEYAELIPFCEAGFLKNENFRSATNADTFSSSANVDDGLPPSMNYEMFAAIISGDFREPPWK